MFDDDNDYVPPNPSFLVLQDFLNGLEGIATTWARSEPERWALTLLPETVPDPDQEEDGDEDDEGPWLNAITPTAWRTLEWVVWLVNHDMARGDGPDLPYISVTAIAPLNGPGRGMSFTLHGTDRTDPGEIVDLMQRVWEQTRDMY